jgi:hypothetical protein
MRRRINSRSKGFLEVERSEELEGMDLKDRLFPQLPLYAVQYLHRTVKDYFATSYLRNTLKALIEAPYDAHIRLCAGILACLKRKSLEVRMLSNDQPFWDHICLFMYHASKVLPGSLRYLMPLLDELDRTGADIVKRMASRSKSILAWNENVAIVKLHESGQWMALNPESKNKGSKGLQGRHLLSVTARHGILEYVRAKLSPGCLIQQSERPGSDSSDKVMHPLLLVVIQPNLNPLSS